MMLITSLRMGDAMGAVNKMLNIQAECKETGHTELYCSWQYNFNHWPDYPMYSTFPEYLEDKHFQKYEIDLEMRANDLPSTK